MSKTLKKVKMDDRMVDWRPCNRGNMSRTLKKVKVEEMISLETLKVNEYQQNLEESECRRQNY